eukprot:TRINITY_DN68044_c0_g1_i1.p1 TRINITY_DN68044_c0_g1~~TRINITY_DN68044_c0_g1_i1.p1  ORF type:complete len:217 (-),score=28.63 TRINITY_DN68044_c0_g1_i1:364-1014(-)
MLPLSSVTFIAGLHCRLPSSLGHLRGSDSPSACPALQVTRMFTCACDDGTMYEVYVKNSFIHARPVVHERPRRNTAPGLLVDAFICEHAESEGEGMTLSDDSRCQTSPDATPVTTQVLRGVPREVTEERMAAELAHLGFAGTYDKIYFPKRANGSRIGYGFVQFFLAEDAARFKQVFDGYRFAGIDSSKMCYVSPADVEGRGANLNRMDTMGACVQ